MNGKLLFLRKISNAVFQLAMVFFGLLIIKGIEDEKDFIVVFPLDKTADNDGLFPCGDVSEGIEKKLVSIPKDFKNGKYILRLSWGVSGITHHSCSDINSPKDWIRGCSRATKEINKDSCNKVFTKTQGNI